MASTPQTTLQTPLTATTSFSQFTLEYQQVEKWKIAIAFFKEKLGHVASNPDITRYINF